MIHGVKVLTGPLLSSEAEVLASETFREASFEQPLISYLLLTFSVCFISSVRQLLVRG